MKILNITPAYEPAWHLGGVVRGVSQVCRGLAKLGHEVTVFTTDSGQDRGLEVPVNTGVDVGGVEVFYFKTDFFLNFAYSRSLGQACRRRIKDFDLVHLTAFWCYPGIVGGHYARTAGIPYVVSTAGTLRPSAMQYKWFKKWLYLYLVEFRNLRGAAAIRCVTTMEREQNDYLPLTTPSFILANGIDPKEFHNLPAKPEARRRLGLPEDKTIAIFIGRLTPEKNVDVLLQGLELNKGKGLDLLLIIAGPDFGELRKLEAQAKNSGIGEAVRFLGMITPEERNIWLSAADFLCLTSEDESFGYTAVEALFAGLPVLITEGVGIHREVAADGAGIVVPLKVEAVARGLASMAINRGQREQMAKKALNCARQHFDLQTVAIKMTRAYEDILSGNRSPELMWSDRSK